jgi:hypothetical protein
MTNDKSKPLALNRRPISAGRRLNLSFAICHLSFASV